MIKNIILNSLPLHVIVLVLSFFNTVSASQSIDYVRDYRGGDQRVIKANVTNTAGNDIVDNILTSLAHNNTLFVCYSGYKFVSDWSRCGGNYRRDPINPQLTNILTEIDLHTKIEHQFQTPKEIDDNLPVTDIIRWKDNYCVAHAHDIYVYHASYGWITSHKLMLQQLLHCNLSDADDVIKKIFVDQNSNILGISAHGFIFKSPLATTSTPPINVQPIFNIFNSQDKQEVHSFAYNQKANLLLCGCTGSIKVVALNATPPTLFTITTAPNFSINTIDTNDTFLLFSDLHIDLGHRYDEHAKKPCCMEKTIPYNEWPDCENCKKAQKKWDNTPISLTINKTGQYFMKEAQNMLNQHHPKPELCAHKICPAEQTTLPDSCLNTNIILITLENLDKYMQCHTENGDIKNLNPLKRVYRVDDKIKSYDSNTFITDIVLSDDFLFIGIIHTRQHDRDIYKFPLNTLRDISETLDLKHCDNRNKNNWFLYHHCDGDSDSSSADYLDYTQGCPLTVNKSLEDRAKIVLSRIIPSCSMWHQGACPDGTHHFRYVTDIMTFVKKNTSFDIRQNALTISLERTLVYLARYAKIKISLLIFAAYIAYTYDMLNFIKSLG